jgi:sialic acid synthase
LSVYLIAEIGQNHQGSVQAAKDLVEMAAAPSRFDTPNEPGEGVNAVKLTLRDLRNETTLSMGRQRYESPNSFGTTYSEHRRHLELTHVQHHKVYRHAKLLGLDFIETVCATSCLEILEHFTPDSFKIASRDLTNDTLIGAVAKTCRPIILSTGMVTEYHQISDAVEIVMRHHDKITILHCVSAYPAPPEILGMGRIVTLWEFFLQFRIGCSDHSQGLVASTLAVALGAEVVERHVTLDRAQRGTDHLCALDRGGVWRWVRDTRYAEQMLEPVTVEDDKLQRSVAASRTIVEGETITEKDVVPLSPGHGIPWSERDRVVGTVATQTVKCHELLDARGFSG